MPAVPQRAARPRPRRGRDGEFEFEAVGAYLFGRYEGVGRSGGVGDWCVAVAFLLLLLC